MFPIGLLYLIISRSFGEPQHLVVVLTLAHLQLFLCFMQQLAVLCNVINTSIIIISSSNINRSRA